ncbi:MAG: hypothetical protein KBI01_09175 [Oscillospiraceae bacterium]|nr:hypothetical protein [Oscillospiraceae bacterium]
MVDTKAINNYLEDKGIKHSNLGFRYLLTAILLGIDSPSGYKRITDMYETVATVHHTDAAAVEHAIRYSISKKNITNKEFITKAVDELSYI